MISKEIAAKFHLPPIEEYNHPADDWYHTFLSQSDYIVLKAAEAVITGKKSGEDYTEIIAARQYCRDKINEGEK